MPYYRWFGDGYLARPKGMRTLIEYNIIEQPIKTHFRWCKDYKTAQNWIERNNNKVYVIKIIPNICGDGVRTSIIPEGYKPPCFKNI